jgi:hypothetical protein
MSSSDKARAPAEDATRAEPPAPPVPLRTIASVAPGPRRTIASYVNYADAERSVDRLADRGFPVERGAIVGIARAAGFSATIRTALPRERAIS